MKSGLILLMLASLLLPGCATVQVDEELDIWVDCDNLKEVDPAVREFLERWGGNTLGIVCWKDKATGLFYVVANRKNDVRVRAEPLGASANTLEALTELHWQGLDDGYTVVGQEGGFIFMALPEARGLSLPEIRGDLSPHYQAEIAAGMVVVVILSTVYILAFAI